MFIPPWILTIATIGFSIYVMPRAWRAFDDWYCDPARRTGPDAGKDWKRFKSIFWGIIATGVFLTAIIGGYLDFRMGG